MDPANHVVFEYFAEIFGRMSFTLACWAQLFILTLTCGKWPKWPSLQPFTYQDGYQAVPRLKFRKVSNFVFGDVETMSGLCWSRRSRHKLAVHDSSLSAGIWSLVDPWQIFAMLKNRWWFELKFVHFCNHWSSFINSQSTLLHVSCPVTRDIVLKNQQSNSKAA